MNNKEFGDYGEQIVTDYLASKGCKILDRNYRANGTEIDIICLDKKYNCICRSKEQKV